MIPIITCIIALIIYIYMLVHAYKCEGDIECISDIAYDKHSIIFPLCMTTMAVCLFLGMYNVTPSTLHWLTVLPAISIAVVGFTPYKDNKIAYYTHLSFALLSFISTFALWACVGYWYVPFLFCLAALRKKWLLGFEMGLLGSGFMFVLMLL